MKPYLLSFLCAFVFSHIQVFAQFSSYSSDDNEEEPAYQVEELSSEEIKIYNSFIENGMNNEQALMYINAGRAHTNLECAPATIIDFSFDPELDELDSIPDALGACGVFVKILNTTPKTIKEITLEFEFKCNGTQVYDIKTGDKYCVLKFQNLKGRTKSTLYSEIIKTVLNIFYNFDMSDASYKKLFYNKKSTTISLHRVAIKYSDGTSSNKAAIFYNGFNDSEDLFHDGPLKPLISYMNKIKREI